MNRIVLMAFIGGLTALILPSCNKEQDGIANQFTTSSEDMTTQQYLLEVNESEINEQLELALNNLTTRGYPTRTWSQPKGTYPNTLTIDYGLNGVTGPNGHVRKGKLVIDFSAPMNNSGAVRTLNHQDFSIDQVQIEGTITLTNQGTNTSGELVLLREALDRSLTFPSGKMSGWNATQTLTQVEGFDTDQRLDDVWSITGIANGTNREGNSFSVNTSKALLYPTACRWIVAGVIDVVVSGEMISINYGDGSCNNDATLTLPDGNTLAIKIRRWW
ncbi:MAG: hypothetical protein IPM34_14445 [Saprospiraceae bacterium]|nr:hypothetical protein [Saprospiraceae bacterium]